MGKRTWTATAAMLFAIGCGGGTSSEPAAGTPATNNPPAQTPAARPDGTGATGGTAPLRPNPSPQPAPVAKEADSTPAVAPVSPVQPAPVPDAPAPPQSPAAIKPAVMPKVSLGQGRYAQSTLLNVGDTIPELALADLNGAATNIAPASGQDELRVLVFWDSTNAYSTLELRYLERDVAGTSGVKIVAINRGETAESVTPIVDKEKLSFPVLLDAEGAVFGKFATEVVPRTYLIDADGKILWLEVTFQGHTTIQTLRQAIAAAQGK